MRRSLKEFARLNFYAYCYAPQSLIGSTQSITSMLYH